MPAKVGHTPAFRSKNGDVLEGSVAQAGLWRIGGIDQWVMVRGQSLDNPVLINLHGGPGSPETAFYRAFNSDLEAAYTVVYWDQRGAGRTFDPSTPPETMTIDRFVLDLNELVDRVLATFGKRQVALLGHSWGSALGVLYAARYPEKVSVYVGVGQVADMAASEAASYDFVLAEARARGNARAITQLQKIGPPPHTITQLLTQRRWLTAMGGSMGRNLSMGRLIWRGLRTPEASLWDLVRLGRGAVFTLGHLWPQLVAGRLRDEVPRLAMPVFFLLGRLDMQVAAPVSAAYFEALEAPQKALIWFEESGHMVPFEEPDRFNRVMIETVRPFTVEAPPSVP